VVGAAVATVAVASLPWYEHKVARYMELRAGVDGLVHQVTRKIDPQEPFVLEGDSLVGVSYYLDWRLAAKGSMTLEEIDMAARSFTKEEQSEFIQAINNAASPELLEVLVRLAGLHRAKSVVLIARPVGKTAHLLSELEAKVCHLLSCAGGKTEAGRYLHIEIPTSSYRVRDKGAS
jgi:hypothetical protein